MQSELTAASFAGVVMSDALEESNMKSIDYWRRTLPIPTAPNDAFEELRHAFYVRLRSR
jgi:hypothetical protein